MNFILAKLSLQVSALPKPLIMTVACSLQLGTSKRLPYDLAMFLGPKAFQYVLRSLVGKFQPMHLWCLTNIEHAVFTK